MPQGGSASSLLTNLYLNYYENLFISNFKLYRYADDILIISQSSENTTPEFYPKNLQLVKSNNDLHCVNFLDLNICYDDVNDVSTDLFHKKNEFIFSIAEYQFFNSCLRKNIILNQLIRIYRLTSKQHLHKQLANTMKLPL